MSNSKTRAIQTLAEYFETKGRVMSRQEYTRETDTPIRFQQLVTLFGSWNKVEKLLMAREARDAITNIDEVLAAKNRAALEANKQWREASENQDKKALREAEAQYVAEVLAKNAATPEGANANKIAIGGPLPSEQPDFDLVGATVETDPKTREQTVVNTKPEIVTTSNKDPKTPQELRDAVREEDGAKDGSPDVGHATDGGSQGTASISTTNALGADSGDEKDVADKSKAAQPSTSSKTVPNDKNSK